MELFEKIYQAIRSHPFGLNDLIEDLRVYAYDRAMKDAKGSVTEAAKLLKVNRSTASMRIISYRKMGFDIFKKDEELL